MDELEQAKKSIDLLAYITSTTGSTARKTTKATFINPCPCCGHKDHFAVSIGKDGNEIYNSFSHCCKGGSIIDYLINVEGLNKENAIIKTKEIAGIYSAENTVKPAIKNKECDNKMNENKILISSLTAEGKKHLSETEYFKNRKISEEVAIKNNFGFLPNGCKFGNSYKIIIPISETFATARYFGECEKSERYRNIGESAGQISNINYIKEMDRTIFIVESWANMATLESVGQNSISLNSTSNTDFFIDEVVKNAKTATENKYIIATDNDEAGEKCFNKISQELSKIGINVVRFDLGEHNDINDFAVNDNKKFIELVEKYEIENSVLESESSYLNCNFFNDIEENKNKACITTGFKRLDIILGGGLHEGELSVIPAETSLGKTALVMNIADNVAESGKHVMYYSLEMGKTEMTSRNIAKTMFNVLHEITTISDKKILIDLRNMKEDDKKLKENIEKLRIIKQEYQDLSIRKIMNYNCDHDLYTEAVYKRRNISKNLFLHEGNFNTDINTIKKDIERHIRITGKRPLVIIDYLQILKQLDPRALKMTAVETNIIEMKRIARDLKIHVIGISSVNRNGYTSRLTFSSMKETGSLEFTADNVFALNLSKIDEISKKSIEEEKKKMYMEEKGAEIRLIELEVLKQRNGGIGNRIEFQFTAMFNDYKEMRIK